MAPRNTTPAAAATTKATTAVTEPDTTTATTEDPFAGLSNENEDAAVADLLTEAKRLDDEKANLYGRIEANRSILRNYVTLGKGSEVQHKAVSLFYPKPKRNGTTSAAA